MNSQTDRLKELKDRSYSLYENKEYEKSRRILRTLIKEYPNDGYAYNLMGVMFERAYGIKQNLKKAFEYYSQGVERNFVHSFANLGNMFDFGVYVKRDMDKAVELYQKAIELGSAYALVLMGNIHYKNRLGKYGDEEKEKAVEYYKRAVEQGSAYGMFMLSECYGLGHGVERDLDEAERLLLKAFEGGSMLACESLADLYMGCYHAGWGYARYFGTNIKPDVKKDNKKAVPYLNKLVEKGDKYYARKLAEFYYRDEYKDEFEPNFAEAYRLIKFSAEKDDYNSRNLFEKIHSEGISEPFEEESNPYVVKFQEHLASKSDSADMKRVMAFRYAFGLSVGKDGAKAESFYKQLCDLGDARGMFQYGFCLAYGISMDKDENKAIEIWKKSAELGSDDAKKSLELRGY
jgi:TPR repeat protein